MLEESDELAASSAPLRLREFIERFMQLQEQHREWGIVAEAEFKRLSPEYLKKVVEGRRRFGSFVEGIIQQVRADVALGNVDDTREMVRQRLEEAGMSSSDSDIDAVLSAVDGGTPAG